MSENCRVASSRSAASRRFERNIAPNIAARNRTNGSGWFVYFAFNVSAARMTGRSRGPRHGPTSARSNGSDRRSDGDGILKGTACAATAHFTTLSADARMVLEQLSAADQVRFECSACLTVTGLLTDRLLDAQVFHKLWHAIGRVLSDDDVERAWRFADLASVMCGLIDVFDALVEINLVLASDAVLSRFKRVGDAMFNCFH